MNTFYQWLAESESYNEDLVQALQQLLAAQGGSGGSSDQYGRRVNYDDMEAIRNVQQLAQSAIKRGLVDPQEFEKLFKFVREPGSEAAYAQQIQKCIKSAQQEYYAPHYKSKKWDDDDE